MTDERFNELLDTIRRTVDECLAGLIDVKTCSTTAAQALNEIRIAGRLDEATAVLDAECRAEMDSAVDDLLEKLKVTNA